jgi:hypothetical protein
MHAIRNSTRLFQSLRTFSSTPLLLRRFMSEAQKPFLLYFAPTPNGYQPAVLLEELKEAYPNANVDYEQVIYRISIYILSHILFVVSRKSIFQRTPRKSLGSSNSIPTAAFRS